LAKSQELMARSERLKARQTPIPTARTSNPSQKGPKKGPRRDVIVVLMERCTAACNETELVANSSCRF
jgi:hypothetical protein